MRAHHAAWGRGMSAVTAFALATGGLALVAGPAAADEIVEEVTVTGTVLLPQGADPAWLTEAEIDVYSDADYGYDSVDPETGEFTIEGLLPGEYEVEIGAWEYYDETSGRYVQPNLQSYEGHLTVPAEGVTDAEFTLELGRTISGTVSLAAGLDASELAAVEVVAFDPRREFARFADVDPVTGEYTITGLDSASYLVAFEAYERYDEELGQWIDSTLASELYRDAYRVEDATAVDATRRNRTNINATLGTAGSISGVVTAGEGVDFGDGPQPVYVWVEGEFDSRSAWADPETGEYTVSGLTPGEYVVRFSPQGHYDQVTQQWVSPNFYQEYYDDAFTWDGAERVTVDGAVTGIDATLDASTSLSGTVTLPEGIDASYLNSVTVTVTTEDQTNNWSTYVELDGSYAFENLPPTDVYVSARSSADFLDLAPEYWDDAASLTDASLVSLAGTGATDIDFALEEGFSISGTVSLDEAAVGAADHISVYAIPADGAQQSFQTSVNPDTGAYEVNGLAATEYYVAFVPDSIYDQELGEWVPSPVQFEFWDNAYTPEDAQAVSLTRGSRTGIDATLSLGGAIAGTVTVPEGTPDYWPEPIEVIATGVATGATTTSWLNSDGTYLLAGLAADDYLVEFAVDPDWQRYEPETALTSEFYDDGATAADATLVPVVGGQLTSGIDAELTMSGPLPRLSDVAKNPFATEIAWLAGSGITRGWSNGDGTASFRPLVNVNRDVMAAFLYRLAGEPQYKAPADSPFKDVPTTHVFYKEISWLAHEGISTGWEVKGGGREFRPAIAVNRDVMATFLYRFAGEPAFEAPPASPFLDVDTDHVFYTQISWLASTGISEGWAVKGGAEFRPTAPVKRDVMAAFLYRFADKGL